MYPSLPKRFLCLLLGIIIFPFLLLSQEQKKTIVTIDPLTRLPDKPFPFDEHFSIVYEIDKGLSVENVQCMRVTNKKKKLKNKKVTLESVDFKLDEKNKKKQTLTILMPPLPPGKTFEIVIIYDSHPKVAGQLERLRITHDKSSSIRKFVSQYSAIEQKMTHFIITPIKPKILNAYQIHLLELAKEVLKVTPKEIIEQPGDRPKLVKELIKKRKDYYTKRKKKVTNSKVIADLSRQEKEYESQAFLDFFLNADHKSLAFLTDIKKTYDGDYGSKDRDIEFPNVTELKRIFDASKDVKIPASLDTHYQNIFSQLNNCCSLLTNLHKMDTAIFRQHRKTIARLLSLDSDERKDSINQGYYPFFKQKKLKRAKLYSERIKNLDQSIDLLWELSQDFRLIKGCSTLVCNGETLISLLDEVDKYRMEREKVKALLSAKTKGLFIYYFEWLDGKSEAAVYKTAVEGIIKSDIGFAFIPASYGNTVRPYYGFSINFRSVNNQRRFRDVAEPSPFTKNNFGNWMLYHTSIDIGATVGSIAIEDIREDLYLKANLLAGLSLRIPKTGIRFSGGTMLYQSVNPNPLLNDTDLAILPYFGMKVDLTISKALGQIVPLFIK